MITGIGYWYFIKGKWVRLSFNNYETYYTYGVR